MSNIHAAQNDRLNKQAMPASLTFYVAERASASTNELALLRWSLVVVFLWFGAMKFTGYEAAGIAPFIANSPLVGWTHVLLGVQGASYLFGVLELLTAVALIAGSANAVASAVGAAMSCCTYLITLSFFLTTPGVAEATAGGFPAISAAPGQFLLKDLVLLAASLNLLFASMPTLKSLLTERAFALLKRN